MCHLLVSVILIASTSDSTAVTPTTSTSNNDITLIVVTSAGASTSGGIDSTATSVISSAITSGTGIYVRNHTINFIACTVHNYKF